MSWTLTPHTEPVIRPTLGLILAARKKSRKVVSALRWSSSALASKPVSQVMTCLSSVSVRPFLVTLAT